MDNERRLPIPQIQIIMGTSIALIYLVVVTIINKGENDMSTEVIITSAVAIVVALIGCGAGIWGQYAQFKKDGSTIKDIKVDTTKLDHMNEDVKEIKNEVIKQIVPDLKGMQEISLLVDDYKYREKIRLEKSVHCSQDLIQGSIKTLFQENARLSTELQEAKEQNLILIAERDELSKQVQMYKKKNREVR